MTIALINNFHPSSGIGKYSFNLFGELQRQGKKIEMVYLESKDNLLDLKQMEGIKKVRQGFHSPVFNKTISWYYYFPGKIPRGYELYHASSQYLAKIARFRQPCVITHMDLALLLFPKDYPLMLRFFLKRVLRFYRQAERILTISRQARAELIKWDLVEEEKIKVIPLGFDERLYKPMDKEKARKELGLPLDKKIVLNIGSEEPRKNIPTLLKTMHSLQKSLYDVILVRVGNRNPAYDESKKGLEIRHFSGIPEEKMPLFYNAADVFIFPTIYEGGFAYPPLEAMACALPVIVSKELQLFEKGTLTLNADDLHGFEKETFKILSDEKTHRKLSQAAFAESRNFTLAKEAKETFSVYSEVLNEK